METTDSWVSPQTSKILSLVGDKETVLASNSLVVCYAYKDLKTTVL